MDPQIANRLFALKYNLDCLLEADIENQRDAILDCGLSYGMTYLDDEWYKQKRRDYDELVDRRNKILFTCVLNFTQCFYSIKEYCKKLKPQYHKEIESFFSDAMEGNKPRKALANDLKHNPDKDLNYGFRMVGEEIRIENKKQFHTVRMKHSWFYGKMESIEHCTQLYSDLISFLKEIKLK